MAPSTRRRWALCRTLGLMAQQAEEYGSHDQNVLRSPRGGTVRVVADDGHGSAVTSRSRPVISSGCARRRTRRSRTGSKLGVRPRAPDQHPQRCSGSTPKRAPRCASLIAKVETYLKNEDTSGLDIRILAPVEANQVSRSTASARGSTPILRHWQCAARLLDRSFPDHGS